MTHIGLIDNLQDLSAFSDSRYSVATAAEVMAATGGNTGNVAFVHGARKILGDPLIRVNWGWNPDTLRDRVDHIVICCANQIGEHVDLGGWTDKLEAFDLPVTLLGLGAQSKNIHTMPEVPKGTRRFLSKISKLAPRDTPNVTSRGTFTQKVLRSYGVESEPAGCPSLYVSPNLDLGATILARQTAGTFAKVVVAAGNPWHGPSAALERVLVDIVNEFQGEYVLQHPQGMLQFAYGEVEALTDQVVERFLRVYGENGDQQQMLEWFRHHACVFIDVPNWIRFLAKFDAAVGPRYHGISLALQAGIPGCVVTIDSRTHELCEGTGMKSVALETALNMNADTLVESCRWISADAELFDTTRLQQAQAYVQFLRRNGLTPSDHLLRLARRCQEFRV